MAARSGGSNAFWWTLIGICLGVAGTLAVIIVTGRRDRGPDDQQPPPDKVVMTHAPRHRSLSIQPASAAPASAAPSSIDEQVAQDAAAAGMTSRTHPPQ